MSWNLTSWLPKRNSAQRAPAKKHTFKPQIEQLERRVLLSTVNFSSASQTVAEGDGDILVIVTLSEAASEDVEVGFSLTGTAADGFDYSILPAGSVTIYENDTTATITVSVFDDDLDESSETVGLNMTTVTGATKGSTDVHTITVTDNDDPPTVDFMMASNYGDEDVGSWTVTAQLSAASGKNITIPFTLSGSATEGTSKDYTITASPISISAGNTEASITITVNKDELLEEDETVIVTMGTPTNATKGTTTVHTATIWGSGNHAPPTPPPNPANNVPIPSTGVSIDPNSSNIHNTHPIDITQTGGGDSCCECACNAVHGAATNRSTRLVYSSAAAYSLPVMAVDFVTDPQDDVPDQLEIRLDWDYGGWQSWVSFNTTGHSAGDTYHLPVQLDNAVTATGDYSWQIEVRATYGLDTETATQNGSSVILLHDDSPFGSGWTLSGIDRLITSGSDIILASDGGGRVFRDDTGSFISPRGDDGALVQNIDSTYTYTTKEQVEHNFNSSGYLTTIEKPNGLTTTVTYSSNKVSTITSEDGGLATFTYVSDKLDTIDTPSGTYTMTLDGSDNLTVIENPDGALRSFTYNTDGQMTVDEAPGKHVTLTWDGNNILTKVQTAADTDVDVTAVLPRSLGASTAIDAEDAVAEFTDALDRTTKYDLNVYGEVMKQIDPTGASVTYDRDADGRVTQFTDPLGNDTDFEYDGSGNVTKITYANSTTQEFQYDSTYNKPTVAIDQFGNRNSYTYSATTGELTKYQDPDGNTTTLTYSNGLLQTREDPFSNTTTFQYDSANRVQTIINPYGDRTTFGYDSAGNRTTVEDFNENVTTATYDAMRRLLTAEDMFGNVTSYTYSSGRLESVEDPDGHFTSYTYNALGVPETVENVYEDVTTYMYDDAGQLVEIIGPFNHTTFAYDAAGRQVSVEDTNGNITSTVYDSAGRAIATIDYLNHRTSTTYNSVGQVTGTEDPFGNLTTTAYNADGQVRTHTDSDGNTTTYNYDSEGRFESVENIYGKLATTVYDSRGRISVQIDEFTNRTTNAYDNEGRLESVENTTGFVTFVYDTHGRQHATIDILGNRTSTVFDTRGRVSETIDVNGNTATTLYDTDGRVSGYIDVFTNRVTNVYDNYGRLESVEDSTGFVTYVYDAHGRQHATIDQLDNRTSTVFDSQGRVSETIDAAGNYVTFLYDTNGRQNEILDGESNRTTTVFDTHGRISETIDANGNRTTTIYALDGRMTAVEDANENLTSFHYDSKGRMESVEDARGNFVTTVYDAYGRREATIDQLGNRTTTVFDSQGRVSDTVNALGTTTYYFDDHDRVEAVRDAEGNRTSTVYDSKGRVSETIYADNERVTNVYDAYGRQEATIDQLGNRTTAVFDNATGLQEALIDPINNRTTFSYDALGRETEREDAGGSATFTYNSIGLMSSTTDRLGRRRDFTYDGNGQILTETWIPSGGGAADNIITHSYDANGNRLTIEDENGAYTMTYDALNRVETFEDMWSSLLTFSYDAMGNRTKVEDSEGGVQTSTYDAASNLTKREFDGSGLTPLRIDFTYNGNNQVESITRYSNLAGTTTVATTDYTYDGVGRITNLHHEDGSSTNISNYTYVYDAVGNLSTEELDSTTTTYQYDDTNQLTDDGTNTHEYDANGNRIDGGYDVGPINQYTTDGTWDYSYDAEGNMTEKEDTVADIKWTYGYDHMNRLDSVDKIDTSTSAVLMEADYRYDPLGNRIEKAVDADGDGAGGTDTTRYSYDGFKTNGLSYVGNENWDIWADLDGDNSNALEMRYIRGNGIDEVFARHDDVGTIAWYLNDHLGSVRDMTDNTGVVKNTIAYDGFGNITSESDANFGDRYKWTGREHDVETGLQYNRARYYDAELGRWISKDPLGFDAGDSNLYRYVRNAPTTAVDPSGLEDDLLQIYEQLQGVPSRRPKRPIFPEIDDAIREAHEELFVPSRRPKRPIYTLVGGRPSPYLKSVDELNCLSNKKCLAACHGGIKNEEWSKEGKEAVAGLLSGGLLLLPVLGEMVDGATLLSPDASIGDRLLSGSTLWLGFATAGFSPNACSFKNLLPVKRPPTPFISPANGCVLRGSDPHWWVPPGPSSPPGGVFSQPIPGNINPETVFSGHGFVRPGTFTMPAGTTLTVYTRPGGTIPDRLGNVIETGGSLSHLDDHLIEGAMSYLPGAQVPSLYLYEPTYFRPLNIMGNPVTVEASTSLSSLLRPNMGHTHWASCLQVRP